MLVTLRRWAVHARANASTPLVHIFSVFRALRITFWSSGTRSFIKSKAQLHGVLQCTLLNLPDM